MNVYLTGKEGNLAVPNTGNQETFQIGANNKDSSSKPFC